MRKEVKVAWGSVRFGIPNHVNNGQIYVIIPSDYLCGAIIETVGIGKECISQILHNNLNMKKMCAKIIPKILTLIARKNNCTLNATENDTNFLDRAT